MDDKQLEQLAAQLGDRAAEQLDLERTAKVVVERLRLESEPAVWWRKPRVVRALAAAALVLLTTGVLVTMRVASTGSRGAEVAQTELFELESLSFADLEEVFDSLTYEGPVAELSAVGLDNLDENQLRELLTLMEG